VSDWTEGYVTGVDYTLGYYGELNPLRLTIPFLNVGLMPPPVATACELGFGQGVSINAHAAGSGVRWYGTDFNPGQAAFARALAQASGADAELLDGSFAEFAARTELPQFDYIGLHGVWSWISRENRQVIIDFVRRKLAVGGVLYLSYNTQPGFAGMLPMRHLLREHAERMDAPGRGLLPRIDAALDFADKLLALNPGFAGANPTVAPRLKAIRDMPRQYLAHEYFNRDWHADLFAEIAESLAEAKLTFACSAHYLDHIDAMNLTADQRRFLGELPDPGFRQTVRDLIVNQQFRRDYWIKGGRRLSPLEQAEGIRKLRVIVPTRHSTIEMTVAGPLGTIGLNPEIYQPLLQALGEFETRTLAEVETRLRPGSLPLGSIYEAAMVLAGKGALASVQDDVVQQQAAPQAERLNNLLIEKARSSSGGDVPILVSPVLGGGTGVPRAQQLFLLARRDGRNSPEDLARFAWDLIGGQGQRIVHDGKQLETAEEHLDLLTTQARDFLDNSLPGLRALKVA
jgi:SAM-dependent methyltransferase